jgi:hypothetical protein
MNRTEKVTAINDNYEHVEIITRALRIRCKFCTKFVSDNSDLNIPHEHDKTYSNKANLQIQQKETPPQLEPQYMFKYTSNLLSRNFVDPQDFEIYHKDGWKFYEELPTHLQQKASLYND